MHFSSVHPLGKTFNNDAVEMRFAILLRNMKMSSKNDPSYIRPVDAVIRTAGGYTQMYTDFDRKKLRGAMRKDQDVMAAFAGRFLQTSFGGRLGSGRPGRGARTDIKA
jgi:hypothetical protein